MNKRDDHIRTTGKPVSSAGGALRTDPAEPRKHGAPVVWTLAAAMLLLLLFPSLSLEGARKGLLLWYQTVLPTLLPFMVCTNLVVSMNAMKLLTAPFAPLLKKSFRLSDPGCFVLLSGVLCGYPMGAKNCSDLLDQGCLSLPEARCLYAVSNFPSPMFLAGYMMAKASQTAGAQLVLPFWKIAAAVYLPILPMFLLAAKLYGFRGGDSQRGQIEQSVNSPLCGQMGRSIDSSPRSQMERSVDSYRRCQMEQQLPAAGQVAQEGSAAQAAPTLPLDEALSSSIAVMVGIGGYLMLFSILARFIELFLPSGSFLSCLLISIAEMTTGMEATAQKVRGLPGVLLILGAGTFGGLSGAFQVKSVTKNAGCSIRHYILWKTAHCLLTCLFLTLLALGH